MQEAACWEKKTTKNTIRFRRGLNKRLYAQLWVSLPLLLQVGINVCITIAGKTFKCDLEALLRSQMFVFGLLFPADVSFSLVKSRLETCWRVLVRAGACALLPSSGL